MVNLFIKELLVLRIDTPKESFKGRGFSPWDYIQNFLKLFIIWQQTAVKWTIDGLVSMDAIRRQ
jgi:hypothetical protein